ncbi:AraC family transcriptional regulator [Paenibacillus radicis (ex Gao et al. 2016)]|uniref:AraC family transcriptional regulator n=1 Tax=Paenibacillus radicis (ex Gao et al. 2016) TaxID=1737354 RepID=A0A917M561_9BACL|nr:AraC family transcriptional regulator [Paenibacillus radicis (ex Gao et al. 2016)]GGG78605.1 AraC family transcriptional regulator [Paenibacillus radicis (ex Gao et al. 2016)]
MNKVLDEIIDLMKGAGTRQIETGVPGLSKIKGDIPAHQLAALYEPMIGFTVQGTKILSIGERSINLNGPSYFVLPVHVPATASVHPDRDGRPYMSLGLKLNQNVLQSLLRDLPDNLIPTASEHFVACEMDVELMEAWLRLLRLSKTTRDIPALAPVYEREILYRVLMGPQGWHLRQFGLRESNLSKISQVVNWFRNNFTKPVDIGEMASKSGMAINTFHRQFKRATGLSPIQFQKQLRLLEARNLIAFEGYPVASAAYQVGYQSPSQFNREYSRFFGLSPARDTDNLRRIESMRD